MQKIIVFLLLTCLLFFCFSQTGNHFSDHRSLLDAYYKADEAYHLAEKIAVRSDADESLVSGADAAYQKALVSFNSILPEAERSGFDSLLFFIQLKTGIIHHYFDSLAEAKKFYLGALQLRNRVPIADSFFFRPMLFAGSICYTMNQMDSAIYYLGRAEQIIDKYQRTLAESQRLYNLFGVINYETGNYTQAVNYFEKALSMLAKNDPSEKNFRANYRMNIASTLMKIEEFGRAKKILLDAAADGYFNNELDHKLGIICLKEKNYQESISYFKKVKYDNRKSADLFLNLSMAFSGLDKDDSSELYLLKAKENNLKWNGHQKNITNGLILKFEADELVRKQKDEQAIPLYQQAIIQFNNNFNETDIEKNPETFSNTYSYINLFNTLTAKGDAFERIYRAKKDNRYLDLSLAVYQSAFSLANYVERTYNSDEARLFLGKIKYLAHIKPIDVSLLLYELTQNKKYLEDAFHFDQQNKASVLAVNVRQNEWKGKTILLKELVEKETSLKSALTRLSLRSSLMTDSMQLQTADSAMREYEIQLDKLQEKMNSDPAYKSRYLTNQLPGTAELQKSLDNSTALLSWHLSENEIVVFIITGRQFSYYRSPANPDFFKHINSFKESLSNTLPGERYKGAAVSSSLYSILISPLSSRLRGIDRLIIIPDDELNYLPFEALTDGNGRYLVEKFSIQYLYSTALFGKDDMSDKAKGNLAFAPFASQGFNDSSGIKLSALPASGEELSGLEGKIFTDSNALKENFLLSANHYGIIHLATHASVNNEAPLNSFIAFHPTPGKSDNDYRLYAREIYDLNLDSTQLVILSACETGAGKLVKGEGLMSLSRAFAYAGCPNIVTSLWKAEDKTTALIMQQLHHYLDKGYTKDMALQHAKLDLLKNEETDPRYKTPNYWAHLIFIGNYEPKHHVLNWWWIAIVIIASAILYIVINRKTLLASDRFS